MRHEFRMSVGTDAGAVEKLNAVLAEFARTYALPDAVRRSLNIALDELLANELSHGMAGREEGFVSVEMELDGKCVNVRITDDGSPFDPFQQEAPDTTLSIEDRSIGGLGIHLVRELMDDVSYERKNGHNVVTLVKRLA